MFVTGGDSGELGISVKFLREVAGEYEAEKGGGELGGEPEGEIGGDVGSEVGGEFGGEEVSELGEVLLDADVAAVSGEFGEVGDTGS